MQPQYVVPLARESRRVSCQCLAAHECASALTLAPRAAAPCSSLLPDGCWRQRVCLPACACLVRQVPAASALAALMWRPPVCLPDAPTKAGPPASRGRLLWSMSSRLATHCGWRTCESWASLLRCAGKVCTALQGAAGSPFGRHAVAHAHACARHACHCSCCPFFAISCSRCPSVSQA